MKKSSLYPLGALAACGMTSPLQKIADILSAFCTFVTFHNSFLQMMPKIVKVFTLESLDLFLTLCYNMIDVKIGLATGSLGQLANDQGTLHSRIFARQKSVRGSLVGADNT